MVLHGCPKNSASVTIRWFLVIPPPYSKKEVCCPPGLKIIPPAGVDNLRTENNMVSMRLYLEWISPCLSHFPPYLNFLRGNVMNLFHCVL